MEIKWSLILNALLLIAVVTALMHTLKKKRDPILPMQDHKPSLGIENLPATDDIIAIRKIEPESPPTQPAAQASFTHFPEKTLMIFLLAKAHRPLAGYEMLQTILSTGLRFGEGQLFHRHQFSNGQGPILCSLAAATATGTFDLHNMGGFNAKGLCLFIKISGDPATDTERLDMLFDTAHQLADGLDTYLLDETRTPVTSETKAHYLDRIDSYAEAL